MGSRKAESALPIGPATVAGAQVVTIPLSDYEALLEARRRYELLKPEVRPRRPRSPIEQNTEMKAFIDARLGRMKLSDIAKGCKLAFGERAPSKSAIQRYHQRRLQIEPRQLAKPRRRR